jgi:1-acyl-sn-glycerol-3-phosphate acyltransferase
VPAERPTRAYAWTRRLARRLLASQYRRVEVDGAEHIPLEGPAILVANHGNSLVDSLTLLVASPRPTAPLAKAPLFQSRILKLWLDSVGAVPVYREQDVAENQGRGVRANLATFDACRARLAAGGALVLFPEGVSQSQPRLLPLRTGVARIALDAALPVTIVPVGLMFEAPGERRGTALAMVGEPFVADGSQLTKDARRGAITVLTRRIEAALHGLLAEADSQADLASLRLLTLAIEQEHGQAPAKSLAEAHRRTQRLAQVLARLSATAPRTVEALRAQADSFQRCLALTGVPLALLERSYTGFGVLRYALTTLLPALVLLPLTWAARLLSWPGRMLGDILVLRQAGAHEDVRVLARTGGWAMGTFLVGVAGAVLLGLFVAPLLGLLTLPALALLLAVHVWLTDLWVGARERLRAFVLLAGSSRVRVDLRAQRRALVEAAEAAARAPTPTTS